MSTSLHNYNSLSSTLHMARPLSRSIGYNCHRHRDNSNHPTNNQLHHSPLKDTKHQNLFSIPSTAIKLFPQSQITRNSTSSSFATSINKTTPSNHPNSSSSDIKHYSINFQPSLIHTIIQIKSNNPNLYKQAHPIPVNSSKISTIISAIMIKLKIMNVHS